MLTAESLVASASSTHEVLGGPGRWLLAMPAHHVAGLQVLVRSVVAGPRRRSSTSDGGFDVGRFAQATERLAGGAGRRYTALVPTQLTRLLDDPAGIRALRPTTACSSAARPPRPATASGPGTPACGS